MAVSMQSHRRVGSDASAMSAARGRRMLYGTNVAVTVLVAGALVVVLNLIASRQYKRFDVAGSGLYGLSDRTKKVLADSPVSEITFTSIYTSNEKGKDRNTFLPRVRDLFDELEAAGRATKKKIQVRHLQDDEDKRKLIERVQTKFGSQSAAHKEAIDLARAKWGELTASLTETTQQFKQILGSKDRFLGGFTTFAKSQSDLQADLEEIQQALREVENLTGGAVALPRYDEAARKIKETNEKVKGHLEAAKKWMGELDASVTALQDPASDFRRKTLENAKKLNEMAAELQKSIGDPADTSIPDDPKPSLQAFSRNAGKLAALLRDEAGRVGAFVDKHPSIRTYHRWTVQVNPLYKIELAGILSLTQQTLTQLDQQVRVVLAGEHPRDVLQSAVRQLRELAAEAAGNIGAWDKSATEFLASFGKIDDESRVLLAQAKEDKLFAVESAAVKEVETKFASLPELKTEDIATKFEQDNLVVVETPDTVKVIDFDTVWPRAEALPGMAPNEDDADRRVFNGDAAVAATVLTLGHKEPFATVILTFFEPQPPPEQMQMRMAQPKTGPIPSRELSKLRERLEQANFKVKDWNLAGEDAAPPAPEPNTRPIYVFLPPPGPSQDNPFQPPPPNEKKFGDAELERVREVLKAENARGIFVASYFWPMRSFFGPQPVTYGYEKLLRDDWGVDVKYSQRVVRGVPSNRDVRKYEVSVTRWNWMRLNAFNKDHPVGEPLRARRMLLTDVCPVVPVKENAPKNIHTDWVLAVPSYGARSEYWADSDVLALISQIQSPKGDGTVTKSKNALEPPFEVILTAENTDTKARILALGTGMSLIDEYMDRRVPRLGEEGKISFDPPPRENGDLFVNAVYWLADKPDLIGAGPVTAPPIDPITNRGRSFLKVLAVGWACLVLLAGGAMMLVRRK